jgi:hypothetical protein
MVLKRYFKTKLILFILLPALLLGFSTDITAQNDAMVVQSIGTGIIRGKDIAAAREEAVSNAMVTSVQRAMTDLIPMETFISNFKKLDESIFANIGDYILEYKVLAEHSSGKSYRIMVETTLFSEKIRQILSSLETVSEETELPNVLFFLAETEYRGYFAVFLVGRRPLVHKESFGKSHCKCTCQAGIFNH